MPSAFIPTDVALQQAILVPIDKRGIHQVQLMDVARMPLWFQTVTANVKVVAG